VADYIDTFYNHSRRHSHLGGLSPEQFEAAHKPRRRGLHLILGTPLRKTITNAVRFVTQCSTDPAQSARRGCRLSGHCYLKSPSSNQRTAHNRNRSVNRPLFGLYKSLC
jgi:hypothetical protein